MRKLTAAALLGVAAFLLVACEEAVSPPQAPPPPVEEPEPPADPPPEPPPPEPEPPEPPQPPDPDPPAEPEPPEPPEPPEEPDPPLPPTEPEEPRTWDPTPITYDPPKEPIPEVWVPDQTIRVSVQITESHHSIDQAQWDRVVEFAEDVFERTYIRVDLVDEITAVNAQVRLRDGVDPEDENRLGHINPSGRHFEDGETVLRYGTVHLYMGAITRYIDSDRGWAPPDDPASVPRDDLWLASIASLLAHELAHIIATECGHSEGNPYTVFSSGGGREWVSMVATFGAHFRGCVVDAY